jgi:phytanoyl-CoA hydroxylase
MMIDERRCKLAFFDQI